MADRAGTEISVEFLSCQRNPFLAGFGFAYSFSAAEAELFVQLLLRLLS